MSWQLFIYHSRNRPPPCDTGGLWREKKAPIIIWASDGGEIAKNIKHDWRNRTACISYKLKIFHLTAVNDFQERVIISILMTTKIDTILNTLYLSQQLHPTPICLTQGWASQSHDSDSKILKRWLDCMTRVIRWEKFLYIHIKKSVYKIKTSLINKFHSHLKSCIGT